MAVTELHLTGESAVALENLVDQVRDAQWRIDIESELHYLLDTVGRSDTHLANIVRAAVTLANMCGKPLPVGQSMIDKANRHGD